MNYNNIILGFLLLLMGASYEYGTVFNKEDLEQIKEELSIARKEALLIRKEVALAREDAVRMKEATAREKQAADSARELVAQLEARIKGHLIPVE